MFSLMTTWAPSGKLSARAAFHLQPQAAGTASRVLCVVLAQENPHIPEARVLSEIGILFVEGFETTGHTTSWTLFNIATVPGVQDKIAAGAGLPGAAGQAWLPARPRELELDDLKHLPYLAACDQGGHAHAAGGVHHGQR